MPAKKTIKKTKKPAVKKTAKRTVKKAPTKKKVVKKKPAKKITLKKKVVKKTVKKAEKKVSKKKPTKKQKPALIVASDTASFWVNNGPVLNSLAALEEALLVITVEQFKFHAGGQQNDFAIWVETILLDKECAKALKKAKTQKTASKKVGAALKKYRK